MLPDWPALTAAIQHDAGFKVDAAFSAVTSKAWRAASDAGPLFIKVGNRDALERLSAEAEGLRALEAANAVRVPQVYSFGLADQSAYLAMEWLDLSSPDRSLDREFGAQLAALHRVRADTCGWHRDNTLGLSPQHNQPLESWTEFFAERRLRVQLDWAVQNGYQDSLNLLGEQVIQSLPDLLRGHTPQPSLLHGDLWSGNYGACDGQPVIFDPAVYFGDRETDLAMTSLFGGFSNEFYAAYQEAWPLPPGHAVRRDLYQLYHVLNHLNLFGQSYLQQAVRLMQQVLKSAG